MVSESSTCCLQPSLDRTVAVKVLTSGLDHEDLERFLREQRAMGRLSGHPNIVNVLQVGVTATGRPYLVMQYHALDSLEVRIRRQGSRSSRPARSPASVAGGLLGHCHGHPKSRATYGGSVRSCQGCVCPRRLAGPGARRRRARPRPVDPPGRRSCAGRGSESTVRP